jgi:ABC-type transport system involved in cytochrome c biogenesis permease component
MAATFVGTIVLYAPPPIAAASWFAVGGVLFAVGLAVLATLVADLTLGLRARGAIAALLVTPLGIPLVLCAGQVSDRATASQFQPGGILPWVLILVLADLIGIIIGVLTARPLEESLQ